MALFLLALGVVMSLVGLAAMATGYPIIEVERGWASLITGAILLSGGLVVVSLGLVVRHLVGLRRALSAVGALPQAVEAPFAQPTVVPTPPPARAPARPEMPAAAQLELPPNVSGAAIPVAAAALAADVPQGLGTHGMAHLPEPESPGDPHDAAPYADAAHAHGTVPGDDVHVPEEPSGERPADTLFHAPQPPDLRQDAVARTRTSEDLLDEAFSAFDYEMANGHPRPIAAASGDAHQPVPEPVPTDPSPEPAPSASVAPELHAHAEEPHAGEHHGQDPSAHEPPAQESLVDAAAANESYDRLEPEAHPDDVADHDHAAAAPTAPAEPASDLAVIGRYDSEGTSYVMYSDGSIEAQSEAGVYRFGSMAELKAFIEG